MTTLIAWTTSQTRRLCPEWDRDVLYPAKAAEGTAATGISTAAAGIRAESAQLKWDGSQNFIMEMGTWERTLCSPSLWHQGHHSQRLEKRPHVIMALDPSVCVKVKAMTVHFHLLTWNKTFIKGTAYDTGSSHKQYGIKILLKVCQMLPGQYDCQLPAGIQTGYS